MRGQGGNFGDVRLLSQKSEIGLPDDATCRPFWGSIDLAHYICQFLSNVSASCQVLVLPQLQDTPDGRLLFVFYL